MNAALPTLRALCGVLLTTAATTAIAAPETPVTAAAPAETVITVGEMCGGCVKRIEATLNPVDGIAKVQCDVQKKAIAVWPDPKVKLSPKWLWETMESIGKTPEKLVGPSGTFTEKPES